MPILHDRGYVIPAIGAEYVRCAERLRDSILAWHPKAHITILTEDQLPYGNLKGYANDWQCHWASPYRQTIKLEADMLCASPIDHLWSLFEHRDVVVSQGARNFYDQTATSRHYRKIFDANNLPDLYNAVTYWRVSKTATEFFQLVRSIFTHWDQYRTLLKFPDEQATTDVVYAVAAKILGTDMVTLPIGYGPQIVHMKQRMIATHTADWTRELTWEHTNPGLRINTVAQWGMVHYYVKDWQ